MIGGSACRSLEVAGVRCRDKNRKNGCLGDGNGNFQNK